VEYNDGVTVTMTASNIAASAPAPSNPAYAAAVDVSPSAKLSDASTAAHITTAVITLSTIIVILAYF
jgi:hypothetical protein